MTVHMAADPIRIGHRIIQRCMICGMKLKDDDYSKMASPEPIEISFFSPRSFVEVEVSEGVTQYLVVKESTRNWFDSSDELPPNHCLLLVE